MHQHKINKGFYTLNSGENINANTFFKILYENKYAPIQRNKILHTEFHSYPQPKIFVYETNPPTHHHHSSMQIKIINYKFIIFLKSSFNNIPSNSSNKTNYSLKLKYSKY